MFRSETETREWHRERKKVSRSLLGLGNPSMPESRPQAGWIRPWGQVGAWGTEKGMGLSWAWIRQPVSLHTAGGGEAWLCER